MSSISYKSMYIDSQKKVLFYFFQFNFLIHLLRFFLFVFVMIFISFFFYVVYCLTYMQVEALTVENQRLNGKLENALGKIGVVCFNIIIIVLHVKPFYSIS